MRWTRKTATYDDTTHVTAIQDDTNGENDHDRVAIATETRTLTVVESLSPATLYPAPVPLPTTMTSVHQAAPEDTLVNGGNLKTTMSSATEAPPRLHSHHNSHTPSGGIIAAIVVSALFMALIATTMAWSCVRQRRRRRAEQRRAFSPQNLMLRPQQDSPPLAEQTDRSMTPEPNSWLSQHSINIPGDPRETLSQGVRSPTPKPAVAEMQSFTRAGQKPRAYTVGGPAFAGFSDMPDDSRARSSRMEHMKINDG